MPRDIGPDMLRNLDDQLAAGTIDQYHYAARRTEVEELIRKGKAVVFLPIERGLLVVGGAVVLGGSLILLAGMAKSPGILGFVIAIVLLVVGGKALGMGVRGGPS